jgi:hypothetical protein
MFNVLIGTYQRARTDLDPAVIAGVVNAAIQRARAKHADWDHFAPAIEFLSTVFFTDHVRMPVDDYLETLYCGVKHGDFSKRWREKLRQFKAAAPPAADPVAVNDPVSV